jgi:hypothetical protein
MIGSALTSQTREAVSTSRFGATVKVDAVPISDRDIELFLAYGPGHFALDSRVTHAFIEEELHARAEHAVASRSEFRDFDRASAMVAELDRLHRTFLVSEADVDAELARQLQDLRENYPTVDEGSAVRRAFHDLAACRTHLRAWLEFDRVFLPDDPDDWPAATRDAVREDSGGDVLREDAKASFEERKSQRDAHGSLPRPDSISVNMLRSAVTDRLMSLVAYRTSIDGLPPGIVLRLEPRSGGSPKLEIALDDIWKEIEPSVTDADVREAKRWCVTYSAVCNRMRRDGLLPSEESVHRTISALREVQQSHSSLLATATSSFRFPSIDAYERYYVLEQSFAPTRTPRIEIGADGKLSPTSEPIVERAMQAIGLEQVKADVLLVSAFDIPDCRWKPDGWSWAEKSAREIRSILDDASERHASPDTRPSSANPSSPPAVTPAELWSKLMDERSEYWDQPLALQHTDCRDFMYKHGRFDASYFGTLQREIGESAYDEWVRGESITRHVFFEQPVGTCAGPFRGPLGQYLTFVHQRESVRQRPIGLRDAKLVAELERLVVRWEFADYTREAVAQADVVGFER